MSKKNKIDQANEEMFSIKNFFVKYAKRYGIVLLISVPIILVFNYIMSKNVPGYTGTVAFFVSFAMLLTACFIGLIYFTKKDDKEKLTTTKEKERDPFAD